MEYNEIASVAGKSGLFKVVKPTRTGVILESMDNQKKKIVANATQRISVLSDISIYTTDAEDSRSLPSVLSYIYKEFDDDPGVDAGSDNDELKAFLKHVLPEYDEERVYPSDIKKIISWYKVLLREAPELLKDEQTPSAPEADQ
jgi:hypothetical protein